MSLEQSMKIDIPLDNSWVDVEPRKHDNLPPEIKGRAQWRFSNLAPFYKLKTYVVTREGTGIHKEAIVEFINDAWYQLAYSRKRNAFAV